jgi:hypothetical protein
MHELRIPLRLRIDNTYAAVLNPETKLVIAPGSHQRAIEDGVVDEYHGFERMSLGRYALISTRVLP